MLFDLTEYVLWNISMHFLSSLFYFVFFPNYTILGWFDGLLLFAAFSEELFHKRVSGEICSTTSRWCWRWPSSWRHKKRSPERLELFGRIFIMYFYWHQCSFLKYDGHSQALFYVLITVSLSYGEQNFLCANNEIHMFLKNLRKIICWGHVSSMFVPDYGNFISCLLWCVFLKMISFSLSRF